MESKQYPDVVPGTVVRVHEKIVEVNPKGEEKKRVQIFEGTVLERRHGKGISATITVRKTSKGFGVEKIFPISSPIIEKIEVVKRYEVRRANLGYLRDYFKRLKEVIK
ncbi:50S ribosomal protein L19 [Candidatus Falkowbacteria bacterium RIFOXYA2_FULL_35_8]|uniref:50S ribosomal protein L19 n=1 Tax=Candidatus Falkowbacteria bacterium RIFOXYC2_FULL_36_12 TaxID=1798002 RepID=A0A1F5SYX9_9BACT|nr:MAG: 50S ribosomal protein L19 [Candidatus Falkowbacteria bacterium RIFOXYB2_FULL_35_7]OGF31928.1 MAG: 50S ribosomal protein L19 [Candidatus Falkowbacteria bacterium RIFOXYC2_FULL_36_12]OGF34681.1 MAG: 50S ribosomal protein L19 [Candidatus Falkowbacteria bacterium RIFOXYA2_FULL_35_8]